MLNQRWESYWSGLLHLSRFPLFFLHVSYFKFAAREKPHFCVTSGFFLESEYWLSCFFLQRKTVCPLPRTQTSLLRWKFARKGRREPIVPCASSSVTRESLVFSLASVWKTRHLRRRQICPLKKLECPPENCWLGQIVLLKWKSESWFIIVVLCCMLSCQWIILH